MYEKTRPNDALEIVENHEQRVVKVLQVVWRLSYNPFEIFCHRVHNQRIKVKDQVINQPVVVHARQANHTQTDTIG